MDKKTSEPIFSLRDVSKVFSNGRTALRDINLDIFQGECLLIAGSNGSGKTVLMNILTGLSGASGGTILFKGSPLQKSIRAVRGFVGLVFQDADAQILGETVKEDAAFGPENLGYRAGELEKRVNDAITATGMSGKEDYTARNLSGGEKRRLAVAGVLAMGCEMVIMDEPFANLDWGGVVQVLSIIRELRARGKTLIILTHELEKVLAMADRLVILDGGVIKDEGPPAAVLDRNRNVHGIRDPRRSYNSVEDCTWLEK